MYIATSFQYSPAIPLYIGKNLGLLFPVDYTVLDTEKSAPYIALVGNCTAYDIRVAIAAPQAWHLHIARQSCQVFKHAIKLVALKRPPYDITVAFKKNRWLNHATSPRVGFSHQIDPKIIDTFNGSAPIIKVTFYYIEQID